MATRKFYKTRKSKRSGKKTTRSKASRYRLASTKTARRHRSSTAGKILPPLDVRSDKHLKEFEKRIKNGDLTIILVWAQWCPHCHTMMPHFDAAAKSPNRSIQAIKVEEQMLPAVNHVLTTNVNKSAKPLNVEGYPSIIVVDKQGNKVTDLEPVRNTATMTKVMESAGPLAVEAGINTHNASPSKVATSLNNTLKSINTNIDTNNKNKKLLSNLGVEEEGMATKRNMNESPRNMDVGEDEIPGTIASQNTPNKNLKLASVPLTNTGNTNKVKSLESLNNGIAPSPLNTFNEPNTNNVNKAVAPSSDIKKLSQEAEEVTSLAAPLTPPSMAQDVDEPSESISDSLTAEQKISGGGSKGGSLYSAMARTTYTLAPAAALLATAAMVIKRSGKTHKKSKKSRKSRKQRKQRR